MDYTAVLTLYLKGGNRRGVSCNEGRSKRKKEKFMKAVEATFLSLLELWFTKSWQAGLLCIAKQMGSEVEH